MGNVVSAWPCPNLGGRHRRGAVVRRLRRSHVKGYMEAPREILIHPSVHRPRLILGADRELVIFLGLLAAILVFVLVTWWSVVTGVILWLVGVGLLVGMGREDVLLRHVYLRHVKYRAFYPAAAHVDSCAAPLPRAWSK